MPETLTTLDPGVITPAMVALLKSLHESDTDTFKPIRQWSREATKRSSLISRMVRSGLLDRKQMASHYVVTDAGRAAMLAGPTKIESTVGKPVMVEGVAIKVGMTVYSVSLRTSYDDAIRDGAFVTITSQVVKATKDGKLAFGKSKYGYVDIRAGGWVFCDPQGFHAKHESAVERAKFLMADVAATAERAVEAAQKRLSEAEQQVIYRNEALAQVQRDHALIAAGSHPALTIREKAREQGD